MQAGVLTSNGFLGQDKRPLSDIIAADEELFKALGLDFDQVADRLEELAREGAEGLGEPITVEGVYLVKSDEARGRLPCPFGDGFFHKNAVSVQKGDDFIHLLGSFGASCAGAPFLPGTGEPLPS